MSVKIQAARRKDVLNIQGKGQSINRDYGVAVKISVPESVLDTLAKGGHKSLSSESDKSDYVVGWAEIKDDRVYLAFNLPDGDVRLKVKEGTATALKEFIEKEELNF